MKTYKYLLVAGLLCAMSQPLWADEDSYGRALEAYQKKDYKLANQLIDQFIQDNPDNPNGHEAKAMILANMNHYVKALGQLRQVLELSPKNHRAAESYGALMQRAVNYLTKNGKFDEAVQLAEQSEGVVPQYAATSKGQAATHYACGIAYFERWCVNDDPADYQKYVEHMKNTCELDPVSPTGEIMTGVTCYNNGDYQNALKHFQVAKTLRSTNPTAIMWGGLAYQALGDYESALKYLTYCRKTYSANPNIKAATADVLMAQGKYEDAKIDYMAARALKPHNNNLHYALSDLYLLMGTPAEGVQMLQAEISESPSAQAFYHLALLQHQLGDYASALASCQKGVSMASSALERAQLNAEAALIAYDQNPAQTSVKLSDSEAKLLADQQDPAYWVYMSYADPKAPQRELQARKALRESGPNNRWLHAQAFKSLARNKAESKQPVWALEMLNQAWQRTPSSSSSLKEMQAQFENLKKEAAQYLEKEIVRASKSNKDANSANYLAQLQAQAQAVQMARLAEPGSKIMPSIKAPESAVMIIPADTDPSMANLSNAYSEPISWMRYKEQNN